MDIDSLRLSLLQAVLSAGLVLGCDNGSAPASDDEDSESTSGMSDPAESDEPDSDTDEDSDTLRDLLTDSDTNVLTAVCKPDVDPDACFSVDESGMQVVIDKSAITATIPVKARSGNESESGEATIQLLDLDGVKIGGGTIDFKADEKQLEVSIATSVDITEEALGDYVLHYEIGCETGSARGARSIFYLAPATQAILRGPNVMMAGETNGLRLYVQDPDSAVPSDDVSGTFTLEWEVDGESESVEVFSGKTDALGMLDAELVIPEDVPNTVTLKAVVQDDDATKTVAVPVTVKKPQNILLTTDKPLYQPGQTIHIRSLTLSRPDLTPEAGDEVVIEVTDSKGNKVFKEITETDEFGISSAQFKLASEVLLGTYTIKIIVGDSEQEKAITVDRYTLPKYDIDLETDKQFYAPGDTIHGTIDVQYFFGEPVVAGEVTVVGQSFDLEFSTFASVSGRTDDTGVFSFELELPSYFVGQPLDDGSAFALLQVTVTDTAGQERTIEISRPVVASALIAQLVPESGDIVPGIENLFYLLTTNPQGAPIATDNTIEINGESIEVEIGESGIGSFNYAPTLDTESVSFEVTSRDSDDNEATKVFSFTPGSNGAFVLMRTDRSVYQVGDLASVSITCPDIADAVGAFKDRVYLDIVKDGRTVLMTTVALTDGDGVYELAISPDLAGGFELEAYYLSRDGTLMRDRKVVYVDPADGLMIDVSYDKTSYAPAEEAAVRFTVTNQAGDPISAAIGVQVVDEAVFALMEFKPGIEKVFYAMEQEIMTPRYEIHGYDIDDIAEVTQEDDEEILRDNAASLYFASAQGGDVGIYRDTHKQELADVQSAAQSQVQSGVVEIRVKLQELCDKGIDSAESAAKYILENPTCFRDPWNTPYKIDYTDTWRMDIISLGPDEIEGTEDDVSNRLYHDCYSDWEGEEFDVVFEDGDDFALGTDDKSSNGDNSEGSDGVRVRKDFPETLYVNPAVITDGNGTADITLPLADSITTWRLSALASSKTGLLGSTTSGIKVFQDFFVDIDFPVELTQDDEVAAPIAIYNYLDEAQTITLTVEQEEWFELLEGAEKTIEVGAGEVVGTSFEIRALDVGSHALTIYGMGTSLSDAVQRRVAVVPNGKAIVETESGRLQGSVTYTANIPENAVDGASKIMVKVYPGMMSQAVEGLDSLLQLPSGCFEQTSSSTYPNVMVLNYMMSAGIITPEIEVKAREYVNLGYQRLLTFEVDGGGFEWFGSPPAHNILTAYGLLEFSDMAKVHPVDPAIITRTQAWLAAQQESDGHFEPSVGGIAEGAINAYEDDVARTTAYLTYALLESGYTGSETTAGVQWLKQNYSSITDSYGLAMAANALVAADPDDADAAAILALLHDARIEDENGIHWEGSGESTTFGRGDVINIETTALVGYAMVRSGQYLDDVTGALNYLIGNKDSFGNWQTTQATILTLRLLLATMESAADPGAATVTIYHNDEVFETLEIDEATSDVLRLVDLGEVTLEGENRVRIEIDGDSSYLYQVISRHFVPWEGEGGAPNAGPLSLDVVYDKTDLIVDDIVNASVTVINTVPDSVAKMVLVDVGLPPGFELMTQALQEAVDERVLQKFEKTERQLTLYIEGIDYDNPLTINYQLRALYPVVASSGRSETHPYYSPEESTEATPVEFVVTK